MPVAGTAYQRLAGSSCRQQCVWPCSRPCRATPCWPSPPRLQCAGVHSSWTPPLACCSAHSSSTASPASTARQPPQAQAPPLPQVLVEQCRELDIAIATSGKARQVLKRPPQVQRPASPAAGQLGQVSRRHGHAVLRVKMDHRLLLSDRAGRLLPLTALLQHSGGRREMTIVSNCLLGMSCFPCACWQHLALALAIAADPSPLLTPAPQTTSMLERFGKDMSKSMVNLMTDLKVSPKPSPREPSPSAGQSGSGAAGASGTEEPLPPVSCPHCC